MSIVLRCVRPLTYGQIGQSWGLRLVRERRAAYQAGTAVEALFEVLDRRWALHVVRFLAEGPRRFNEIAASRSINTNTLTSRLKELEASGLVHSEVLSYIPPHVLYTLTPRGQQLADGLQRIAELAVEWQKEYPIGQGYAIVAEGRKPLAGGRRGKRKDT